ncbi:MAG: hypothetical protein LBE34_09400 [Flavobacteriaceae bacterium]|nr:hypothetical protein [Flavobacteriaceae bacterium]
MKKVVVGFSVLGFGMLFGCGQKQKEEVKTPEVIEQKKASESTEAPQVKEFVEGALYYKLAIADKEVNDFMQYAVEDPVQLTDLLEKYQKKTSPQTVTYLQEFFKNNPRFWVEYGQFPFIRNQVFVAGYEAVYKGEGLTYTYENKWNDLLNQGYAYLHGTVGMSSEVNLIFDKPYVGMEQMQVKIDTLNYNKTLTGKVKDIVGYQAQEVVYELKKEKRTAEFTRPERVVAYVSPSFNGAINKVLPFFVDEKNGVLALEIQVEKESNIKLTFEADAIVMRKLTEEETTILSTKAFFKTTDEQGVQAMRMRIAKIVATPRM